MPNLSDIIRIGHWFYVHHIPLLPLLFKLLAFVIYSSSVDCSMRLGKGSFFNHKGFGILINPGAVIGENCKIGNNVSIVGQSPYRNVPKIGNRVYVGPGAVIQGPIIIEDNVIVAPNAVVTKSVPEGAIVGGIPARIIGCVHNLNYDIFANEGWNEDIKPFMQYKSEGL